MKASATNYEITKGESTVRHPNYVSLRASKNSHGKQSSRTLQTDARQTKVESKEASSAAVAKKPDGEERQTSGQQRGAASRTYARARSQARPKPFHTENTEQQRQGKRKARQGNRAPAKRPPTGPHCQGSKARTNTGMSGKSKGAAKAITKGQQQARKCKAS